MTGRRAARLALAGFALVALAGVLLRPAMPIDETRYLAAAWEMWLSDGWLVPSKNFALYTDNPPLLFWAIRIVGAITGVSEIAARLAGPASVTLAIVLAGRLAGALWPEDTQVGSRAMLALSGMLVFGFSGGLTMFDFALAAASFGAVLALVCAVQTGRRRHWVFLGVAIAAGAMNRGSVILIHVLPALLLVPVWAADRARPAACRFVTVAVSPSSWRWRSSLSLARARHTVDAATPYETEGIAYYGQTHDAEFNFAAPPTRTVANPQPQTELATLQAAHPGELIVDRQDRNAPACRPQRPFRFRNPPDAIRHIADAPAPESRT